MTTAADAASYTGRNPKSWTIKAKVNENDEWTTLVTETDNTTVGASNTTPYEFTISGNTTAYKYFRFEVSATQGAALFQLAELQFKGTTTDIAFASVTGVESTYTVSPTPSITPTVTFDNLPLSLGTHYTATLNGNAVTSLPISISEVDDYTLTLTGKGSITGTKSINFRVIGPGDAEAWSQQERRLRSGDEALGGQEGVERVPPVPDLRKAFVFHVAVHRLPKGVDAGVRAAGAKRGNVHAGKP